MIKLVVADLDGTLINSDEPDYEISKELIDLSNQLSERGIFFTIATGRPLISAQPIVKQLNLKCPYIVYNGAQIIGVHGEKIYESYLDLHCWDVTIKAIDEIGCQVLTYDDQHAFCLRHTNRIKIYELKEKIQCQVITIEEMLKVKSSKILFLGDVEKIQEIISRNTHLVDRHKMMQSEDDYLEIVQKGLNKGEALCKLIQYLDIREKVMSIGNHMNDVELLKQAHIGVAVANATEKLKEIADYVTEEAYEKGVVEVIKKFVFKEDKIC